MDYTVEIYKLDKRCKDGMKLTSKTDFADMTLDAVERANPRRKGYIVKVFETYVYRKNMMSGQEFKERYDTPYFCSPSSESYWSM
jgi:hypothetical protein